MIEFKPIEAFGEPAAESAFMTIAVAAQIGIVEPAMNREAERKERDDKFLLWQANTRCAQDRGDEEPVHGGVLAKVWYANFT